MSDLLKSIPKAERENWVVLPAGSLKRIRVDPIALLTTHLPCWKVSTVPTDPKDAILEVKVFEIMGDVALRTGRADYSSAWIETTSALLVRIV